MDDGRLLRRKRSLPRGSEEVFTRLHATVKWARHRAVRVVKMMRRQHRRGIQTETSYGRIKS